MNQEKLQQARRDVADSAFERYDFDTLVVHDRSGWTFTTGDGEWTCPVFVKEDEADEAWDTTTVHFVVRFGEGAAVREAYAIDAKGQHVGHLPSRLRANEHLRAYVERDRLGEMRARYKADDKEVRDNVDHAIQAFGHLLKRNERLSFDVFANRIARRYDVSQPRTAEIVRNLRLCGAIALPSLLNGDALTATRTGSLRVPDGIDAFGDGTLSAWVRYNGFDMARIAPTDWAMLREQDSSFVPLSDFEAQLLLNLVSESPRLFQVVRTLAGVQGNVTVKDGVLTLEDGTAINLNEHVDRVLDL
ncbi:hypothetical protein [Burkholderia sp. Ac-20365]|uniref:hypothetical protein n=1 Tax=Burkholderia sp. Ac-20365 TaxID=2703897 RepID=UPI00197C4521|nr:hypothetical protein [Burkholderia sp. Ac-20365]MBN3760873.1 hypothetical protein [Burkholderia sp. Ac-20365]